MDHCDIFSDEPQVTQARAGGKFQPRAKQRPRRDAAASLPSAVPNDPKKEALAQSSVNLDLQHVQPANNMNKGLKNSKGSSLDISATLGTKESFMNNDGSSSGVSNLDDSMKSGLVNLSSQTVVTSEDAGSADVLTSDILMSDNNAERNSVFNIWKEDVGFELDPFNELGEPALRKVTYAGGKFQPKVKSGPKKGTSGSVHASLLPCMNETTSTQVPAGTAATLFQPVDDSGVSGVMNPSQVVTREDLHPEVAVSDGCGDSHSSFGKSVGEAVDIFSGLETCFNQFLTQSSSADVKTDRIPAQGFDNSPARRIDDVAEDNLCPDYSMTQDPVTYREADISNNDAGIQIDNQTEFQKAATFRVETEDIVSDATIASEPGQQMGKFKPKSRLETNKEKPSGGTSQPTAVESVMHPPNADFVPSETECIEDSIPVFPTNDVFNYSSLNFSDFVSSDPSTSEVPTNEEPIKIAETSNVDSAPPGDIPGMTEEVISKTSKKSASTASSLPQKSKRSSSADKQAAIPELVDEAEDETFNYGRIDAEWPTGSVADDVIGDDDETNIESTSPKKRAPRKPKKVVPGNEKQARKCKKASEESDQPAKEPPKRFSHSTSRKRRCVDKTLLETEEHDYAKLAIKDLILLAEYKERLAKKEAKETKEAKTSKPPATDQSTQNPLHEEDAYNEENAFPSEHDQGPTGDQVNYSAPSSSFCLNYQSFMDKEPRARWSKQETELFYEAIRQFGTDLSMIQQLFPGRSRHQIKLKFKNEERRHPVRISEAVASRAKDHSHFEKVIKRLQEAAAQTDQGNGDDSVGMTGGEDVELIPETNVEAAKREEDGDLGVEDGVEDVNEVDSPSNSNQSDYDPDVWSSYKSVF